MTRAGGPFVVDTSVAMAWVFEDEATPATDALLERLRDGSAVVPSLWRFEVANVLAVAERRGRITEAQSVRFSRLLGALPIDVDDDPATLQELVHTARHHGLSAYGCATPPRPPAWAWCPDIGPHLPAGRGPNGRYGAGP